ncbi:MAG: hypothetical protein O3B86_14605, partial [Planctomycetota bacterium]|nr:hypothetical protein [Planctomycetota bacterium]
MTANSNSPRDPDSWEGLARDLFGIDVGQSDSDDEAFEVIELSSLEPVADTPAEIREATEPVSSSDLSDIPSSVADDDFDDDSDIIFDDGDED